MRSTVFLKKGQRTQIQSRALSEDRNVRLFVSCTFLPSSSTHALPIFLRLHSAHTEPFVPYLRPDPTLQFISKRQILYFIGRKRRGLHHNLPRKNMWYIFL